jgi:hypothetical protein
MTRDIKIIAILMAFTFGAAAAAEIVGVPDPIEVARPVAQSAAEDWRGNSARIAR